MKTVGIVGAGPAGLYASKMMVKKGYFVYLWEKEPRIGGRTRMGNVDGRRVVGGAGVVRQNDRRLRREASDLLEEFKSSYHIGFQSSNPQKLKDWIRVLREDFKYMDRKKDFQANMIDRYGKDGLCDFIQWVGYTDFLKADVVDTVLDYSFEDCLPGQTMYMVDWDKLMKTILPTHHMKIFLRSPVQKVQLDPKGGFLITSGEKTCHVDVLIWTAPRPSWSLLDPLFLFKNQKTLWTAIKKGVACQPFLRLYSSPQKKDRELATKLYPKHTLLPCHNPLGKIIPYGKDLYMMSYSDNRRADRTFQHRNDKPWLNQYSGIRWMKTKAFYWPCGTHYYNPLDQRFFSDRGSFLKLAQNPLPNLFIGGEGLSQNQGWTEGALESIDNVIKRI